MNLSSHKPFFSIIIPLYNKELYVGDSIKSVLGQTFKNFEVIVINDGSTDDSLNVVKAIKDERLTIYSNKNHGLSFSRNFGIKKAKGAYIAFLDADDLWKHDFLDCIIELTSIYTKSLVFATNYTSFFKNQIPNLEPEISKGNTHELVTNYFERQKNIYASSSLVCHRSIFEDIGFFNEHVTYGEEEDFAIRCFSKHNLAYHKTIKVYRLDGIENQLTAPNKNNKRVIPDYTSFLKNDSNEALKKYIDFIHFKLLVLYKMERNIELVNFYKEKINVSNLSLIQKVKFYLPSTLFYHLKTMYLKLSRS